MDSARSANQERFPPMSATRETPAGTIQSDTGVAGTADDAASPEILHSYIRSIFERETAS